MRATLLALCCALLCSCEGGMGAPAAPPAPTGDGGGPAVKPGQCAADADCGGSMVCDPVTKACVPADRCGAYRVRADAVQPNLLLVVDRSCSMKSLVGTQSKWQAAVASLDKLLTTHQGRIRFGITLFPDREGSSCSQGAIPVPVGPGTEAAIKSLLQGALTWGDPYYPNGPCVTNIDTAVLQAAADPALVDAGRPSYLLLLTDGKQALCSAGGGDPGTTKTIKDLQQKKVSTFVVGFGSGVDPFQLDIFAEAGGKPAAGQSRFYRADDQAGLDQALTSIAAQAVSCTLKLGQVPTMLDKIYVYLDSQEVQQDPSHTAGWDYDASTNLLTFHGATCTALEQGKVSSVDVIYGCKSAAPDGGAPAPCAPGVTACSGATDCPTGQGCVAGCCLEVVD